MHVFFLERILNRFNIAKVNENNGNAYFILKGAIGLPGVRANA